MRDKAEILLSLLGLVLIFLLFLGGILSLVWLLFIRPRHDKRQGPAAQRRSCPTCGGWLPPDAPQGLCPKCLLGSSLAGHHVNFGLDSARPAARKTTPAAEGTGPRNGSFTAPA